MGFRAATVTFVCLKLDRLHCNNIPIVVYYCHQFNKENPMKYALVVVLVLALFALILSSCSIPIWLECLQLGGSVAVCNEYAKAMCR